MFSSKTCFLFTILIIIPKSGTNVIITLSDGSFQNETESEEEMLESFIVGGKYARIQDFPHSAFLAISCRKKRYEDFTCGSSILNQWILLSAAHCFENCRAGTQILVSVGARKKTKGTFYSVSKFANHGQYNGYTMKHDIAVAMLSKPLVFSSTVKRVRLSKVGIYHETALLAGWGITNEILNTGSMYLKWTRQKVWQRKQCLVMLPQLRKGYFCGTGDLKHPDATGYAAVGDSGSALIVRGSIQIGIVSYKVSTISNSLILYTDVAQYHNWIASTAKKLFCRH